MKYLLVLLAVLLLTACAQKPLFYYGDTSQRYYRAVKSPDFQTVAAYKRSLEDVFAKSERKGLPVPPGLYSDYALLLLNEGDYAGARVHFEKEKALWAESATFVDFLLSRYGLRH
ncbi:MAG: DUF4810 domain-containing protein [Candidatus Syntrophosphaera sp.]|nr:DUF4810 domain-containing protein [Candidatus Syntrophosphaera sp.]